MTIVTKDRADMGDLLDWDTPQEIAKRVKLDPRTVIKRFLPLVGNGVIVVGSDETLHKRPRKIMRISKAAQRRLGFL